MTPLAIVCEQSFHCYSIGREQTRILAFEEMCRCQKGIKRGSVTCKNRCFALGKDGNVKKVRTPSPQGLDPGKTDVRGQTSQVSFSERKAANDKMAPDPVGSEIISHSLGPLGLKTDI
jgi:hypothetical protein